jgi:hypothetical protein
MEVMYARCAGLDVHKQTVVACVRIAEGGEVSRDRHFVEFGVMDGIYLEQHVFVLESKYKWLESQLNRLASGIRSCGLRGGEP